MMSYRRFICMKSIKKIVFLCFSMCCFLCDFEIQTKAIINQQLKSQKSKSQTLARISGIMRILFPLPVALYNAGCSETSNSKLYKNNSNSFFDIFYPGDITTNFKDVAGLDGAKEAIKECSDLIVNIAQTFQKEVDELNKRENENKTT